jgi:hypothetical protein
MDIETDRPTQGWANRQRDTLTDRKIDKWTEIDLQTERWTRTEIDKHWEKNLGAFSQHSFTYAWTQ